MIAGLIRAEEIPATLTEVRDVMARLEERDLGHWTSRQGQRLRLFRYRPALSLHSVALPLDAATVDVTATRIFGSSEAPKASWIIYLLSERDTPVGYAGIVATESTDSADSPKSAHPEGPRDSSVRLQFYDGCFLPFPDLACSPIGTALLEFIEALLREMDNRLPATGNGRDRGTSGSQS